ncbi:MAG TPA: PepSY domain-containing protein [Steroidobacteraceae bacterium]|nr:PepSY domain-containing protein [Steroidobacteraceae bacterium]
MGRLLARATELRKGGVRVALAGVLLAMSLSLGLSLALQSRTGRAVSPSLADRAVPFNVSFQAPDTAPSGLQNGQGNGDVGDHEQQTGKQLSRAQAVALVQHRYRARVVRSHLTQGVAGRPVYEFRLLASGTVWTVRIDAISGMEVP